MSKSICMATIPFEGLKMNNGIGTYYSDMARFLSKNGWEVTVLVYDEGDITNFAEEYYDTNRIPVYNAVALCKESGAHVYEELMRANHPIQARSHVFHEALQVLMNRYGCSFDLIEFSEWGGAAFVPLNMKRNLGLYPNSRIVVKLHGSSRWHDDGCKQEWRTADDIKKYYYERYQFENADIQVSPTRHLFEWCSQAGWAVKQADSICTYPFPEGEAPPAGSEVCKRNEIVFFGRFEERKGLPEFMEALNYIATIYPNFYTDYKLVFMGIEYKFSREEIRKYLPGYQCEFLLLPRENAIRYIAEYARLVVLPSRLDNFPNTVMECMYTRVPFVTSRAGGIREMLGEGSALYEAISCELDVRSLARLIIKYLRYDEQRVRELLDLGHDRLKQITNPEDILRWYGGALAKNIVPTSHKDGSEATPPGVTVIIPTHNLTTSLYLETALRSLQGQTYPRVEVIVEDSSTEPKAIKVLDILRKRYPRVTFVHEDNEGIGSALNKALPLVKTRYVMEMDGDNIARRDMVETLVKSMENRGDVAGLSCYFAAFRDEDEARVLEALDESVYRPGYRPFYYFTPMGPCLPALFFNNIQGDANSIFLTDVVRSLGGWPEEKRKGFQDWSMWIKMLANGHKVDVVATVLYYYRYHTNNYFKSKTVYDSDEVNFEYIRELIKKRPEYFYDQCYPLLHRAIRDSERLRAQPAPSVDKDNVLLRIGGVLDGIAMASPLAYKILKISGAAVRRIIN